MKIEFDYIDLMAFWFFWGFFSAFGKDIYRWIKKLSKPKQVKP